MPSIDEAKRALLQKSMLAKFIVAPRQTIIDLGRIDIQDSQAV